ncbi:hypothetical protein BH10BAC3_BH10BAC3_41250 [soil metagenome]
MMNWTNGVENRPSALWPTMTADTNLNFLQLTAVIRLFADLNFLVLFLLREKGQYCVLKLLVLQIRETPACLPYRIIPRK